MNRVAKAQSIPAKKLLGLSFFCIRAIAIAIIRKVTPSICPRSSSVRRGKKVKMTMPAIRQLFKVFFILKVRKKISEANITHPKLKKFHIYFAVEYLIRASGWKIFPTRGG